MDFNTQRRNLMALSWTWKASPMLATTKISTQIQEPHCREAFPEKGLCAAAAEVAPRRISILILLLMTETILLLPHHSKLLRVGPCMTEKTPLAAVGTTDQSTNTQVHHQITITNTTSSNMNASIEDRFTIRRNSFKRPPSWAIDPKRILFFFATLSSIGTILLIYFTLSTAKLGADDSALD
ncbi:uncharacterized protein LOC110605615 isoform X2 [Manihot esculenta]|uniref:uncharacterized protein LOC110605615 isoform X2 n=1 Tax=Manihot esculenta TaxID=3983 RepID=UPI000B5D8579|nr:uncharacterized protein LOC110605615 isoform X2 [Manihot esculenta]